MAAWAKIRRAVQRKAAASRRCDSGRSGNLGVEDPCHARDPLFQEGPSLLHALLRMLRPLQRHVAVELVEAEVGVHLENGSLAEGRHFGRDLAIAGEERAADCIEVIGQEIDV